MFQVFEHLSVDLKVNTQMKQGSDERINLKGKILTFKKREKEKYHEVPVVLLYNFHLAPLKENESVIDEKSEEARRAALPARSPLPEKHLSYWGHTSWSPTVSSPPPTHTGALLSLGDGRTLPAGMHVQSLQISTTRSLLKGPEAGTVTAGVHVGMSE